MLMMMGSTLAVMVLVSAAAPPFSSTIEWPASVSVRGTLTEAAPQGAVQFGFEATARVRSGKGGFRFEWGATKTNGLRTKALIFRGQDFALLSDGRIVKVVEPAQTKGSADEGADQRVLRSLSAFYQRLRWRAASLSDLAGRSLVSGKPYSVEHRIPIDDALTIPVSFSYRLQDGAACDAKQCRVRVDVRYDSREVLMQGRPEGAGRSVLAAPTEGRYVVTTMPSGRRPLQMTADEQIGVEMIVDGRRVKLRGGAAKFSIDWRWGAAK